MTLSTMLWPAHGMTSVLTACPLIIFAFSCQPNVCAIFHELPEKCNMNRVLLVAVTCCALLYTFISLAAYMDFGDLVQPNVLQNYCIHHLLDSSGLCGHDHCSNHGISTQCLSDACHVGRINLGTWT